MKLHAQLGGEALEAKCQVERLAEQIAHVEARHQTHRPGLQRPRDRAQAAQSFAHVLAVLREAPGPMTTFEIIDALLAKWDVAEPSREDKRTLYGGVNGSLRRHDGKTVANDGARPARWRIIRDT